MGIMSLPANSTDSPDLGPPPVAHFDSEDPIKFDASLKAKENGVQVFDLEDQPAVLSANLETRKRRKDGSNQSNSGNAPKDESGVAQAKRTSPVNEDSASSQALNPGAKRKLSVREEEEEKASGQVVARKDDFKFNRRHDIGTTNASRENDVPSRHQNSVSTKITEDLATARGANRNKTKDGNTAVPSSARRALEPST